MRLPELLHITQTATIVSFEDTSGTVLQEITTLGGAKDTLAHSPGAPVLSGQWNGDTLQVQRPGPGGGTVTETFTLEDQGNALVIETRIEASGDMPARDFRRVYSRTAG